MDESIKLLKWWVFYLLENFWTAHLTVSIFETENVH